MACKIFKIFKNLMKYKVKTMVQDVPIEYAKNWPVYCSQAEASAYAHWIGKRLPTESEYLRAAYGSPKDETRKYPWGDEEPIAGVHGNFDFNRWGPIEVGSYPKGKSAWGVYELVYFYFIIKLIK